MSDLDGLSPEIGFGGFTVILLVLVGAVIFFFGDPKEEDCKVPTEAVSVSKDSKESCSKEP